jgi:kynurenine formamidase
MPRIIDLTMPIEEHIRWPVDRRLSGDFARGDQFQITWVGWAVHGFTHMDAPRHILPDGKTTSDIPLENVIGECAVLDISGCADNSPVMVETLTANGADVRPGDIVLVKANWDQRYSYQAAEFWTRAPHMTAEAARWLLAQGVKAAAFDFPQDYVIRLLLEGKVAPLEEFVTHDILLRNGVILVEYLCNTAEVRSQRTTLYVMPLKIPNADGAPARVVAIE